MKFHPELFPATPFLEARLGSKVFKNIPSEPGIYKFFDVNGRLLYVGKSKNLRKRLFSYKRKRPGTTSRKESRLLSKVCSLEFDVLPSEEEALLEENLWIRTERPPFNHANKQTEAYYFIRIIRSANSLRFELSMNAGNTRNPSPAETPLFKHQKPEYEQGWTENSTSKMYGCFKGHNPVRRSLGALLQLLWLHVNPVHSIQKFPVNLTRNLAPVNFSLSFQQSPFLDQGELFTLIDDWFLGKSNKLTHRISTTPAKTDSPFFNKFCSDRLEVLESFFTRTLQKHHHMRAHFLHNEHAIIRQDELDDFIVRLKSADKTST